MVKICPNCGGKLVRIDRPPLGVVGKARSKKRIVCPTCLSDKLDKVLDILLENKAHKEAINKTCVFSLNYVGPEEK